MAIVSVPEFAQKLFYDGTNLTGTEIKIKKTWTIEERINNRGTMVCTVTDTNGVTLIPGKEMYFYDKDDNLLWAGIHKKYADDEIDFERLEYKLKIVDFSYIATRANATIAYENRTVDYIVKDLLSRYLANTGTNYDFGISEGTIETGLTELNIKTFNHISIFDCLTELCKYGNFVWNINKNKELNFHTIGYVVNTKILNRDTNRINIKNFKRTRDIDNYRNYQTIKGNDSIEDERQNETPTPSPDGNIKTYTTKFRIAKRPRIEESINGAPWVTKTVGELGKDSEADYDYFWTYGTRHISQSDDNSALNAVDEIRISYQPLIPIMAAVYNNDEITEMGLYEDFKENLLIQNKLDAIVYGQQLLTEYAQIADCINFELYSHDYDVMEQITVNDTLRSISNETFLVESCIWRPDIINHANIVYQYKILDGAALGGWEEFFANLLKPKKISLYDNDVIIELKEYEDSRSHSGTYNMKISTDLLPPSATLQPSATLTPNNTAQTTDSVTD
jgi:hypothetical protein